MPKKTTKKITAKKDFIINRNQDHIVINKGDDIRDLNVPDIYIDNLKTEKVI